MYISRQGEPDPPLGDYLGDLTDELSGEYGERSYITKFGSGGPKNYGYEVFSTRTGSTSTTCKVKGISLALGSEVNFSRIADMVTHAHSSLSEEMESYKEAAGEEVVIHREADIVTTRLGKIIAAATRKTYRFGYDKRVLSENYITFPYGYQRSGKYG